MSPQLLPARTSSVSSHSPVGVATLKPDFSSRFYFVLSKVVLVLLVVLVVLVGQVGGSVIVAVDLQKINLPRTR